MVEEEEKGDIEKGRWDRHKCTGRVRTGSRKSPPRNEDLSVRRGVSDEGQSKGTVETDLGDILV